MAGNQTNKKIIDGSLGEEDYGLFRAVNPCPCCELDW